LTTAEAGALKPAFAGKGWNAVGMEITLLVLMIAGLAAAVVLYVHDRRHAKRESIRQDKMRNGELYQELTGIIRRCKRRYVEQVRIGQECIEFKMLVPAGRKVVFMLEGRGFRPLSQPRQYTLCQLLMQDIPVLSDKSRYTARKEIKPLPNGERAVEYIFTMKIGYKDALNRAPYYMQG